MDDVQVKALFARVRAEQGHLDLLVNNATALGADPFAPPPFWNKSLTISEQFTVGLRSAFVAPVAQNKNIRWKLLAIGAAYIRLGLMGKY